MPAKKLGPATPARGSKLMVGFGLVSVGVKFAPAAKNGRTYAKTLCETHELPIKTKYWCEECQGPCETKKAYEYGGGYVEVDADALGLERSGQLQIEAALDASAIDEYRVEKTYLLWQQPGFEKQFALLVAALRDTGKVLVGSTVLTRTTKSLVLRWSEELQIPVLHVCVYDEQMAWGDVELVKGLLEAAPDVSDQELGLAKMLVDALPGQYAWDEVHDEFEVELAEAMAAAADGRVLVAKEAPADPEPTQDVLAALQASVAAFSQPQPKAPAKKPRAKKAA
jgi:DNA end-binding protein Ku